MSDVKRMVELLPEESLLRDKAWKELQPIVKQQMAPYAQALRQAVEQQEVAAAPDMKAYAAREAEYAGAKITQGLGAPLQSSVVEQVNRARVGKARFEQLFSNANGGVSPWTEQMFKVVDRNVRGGIIQGQTTKQIADQVVHDTISGGVPGVSLQGQTSTKQIRAQAMAMTRTVTQDVNRQVKEEVWDANAEALEGFVYQFSAALDSRTCQTCAPKDGQKWDKKSDAPMTPLHVNCRCQVLLIDPEDEFWNEGKKVGQQISETPYATGYKTKVKVKGDQFYRKAKEFSGNNYGDYLASSNLTTQTEFFGGGPIGQRRANYFRSQIGKVNKDPQNILSSMLTGPSNAKKFVPLPELAKRNAAAIKAKATVKVKVKPAPKPAPKPKPKPVPAVAVTKPKPPTAKPAAAKRKTSDTNYDYDKNWEKLGYEKKTQYRKAKEDIVEWSGNEFEGVRAAQFADARDRGVELNNYERLQARRLEKGEQRSAGNRARRLEDFIDRAPKYDGTIRRGVAMDTREEVMSTIERYNSGKENLAIESWTSDSSVSNRFAMGNGDPRPQRMSILVEGNTRGAPINAISGFNDEFEVLVPSGVRYEVVDVKETFVKGNPKGGPSTKMDHTDWTVTLREVKD